MHTKILLHSVSHRRGIAGCKLKSCVVHSYSLLSISYSSYCETHTTSVISLARTSRFLIPKLPRKRVEVAVAMIDNVILRIIPHMCDGYKRIIPHMCDGYGWTPVGLCSISM